VPGMGSLQGQQLSNGAVRFRNVPFAEPPTGQRRWAPPVDQIHPFGPAVRDAVSRGFSCEQPEWTSYYDPSHPTSEDCLVLSIFTPSRLGPVPPTRRAVLVFFHGGSYVYGGGDAFDGAQLAVARGLLVVTVNYRLGVMGWLPLPTSDGGGSDSSVVSMEGNFGLLDQQSALRWLAR
jgi:para-nitrobenzyl esterase